MPIKGKIFTIKISLLNPLEDSYKRKDFKKLKLLFNSLVTDPLLGHQARMWPAIRMTWVDARLYTQRLQQVPRGGIDFGLLMSLSFLCSTRTPNSSSSIITHTTKELLLHYYTNPILQYGLLLIMSALVSMCLRQQMPTN